jgi:hypothetical protein
VVASDVLPVVGQPHAEAVDRWEMVVPKMIRTGQKTFAPARTHAPPEAKTERGDPSRLFANSPGPRSLPKALLVIAGRTRALLSSSAPRAVAGTSTVVPRELPAALSGDQQRSAAREVFLSKIATALLRRPPADSLFPARRSEEPGS